MSGQTTPFEMDPEPKKLKIARSRVLESQAFDEDYELDDTFKEDGKTPMDVRTVQGLVELAKKGQVEIDARVISVNQEGKRKIQRLDTKTFIEKWSSTEPTKITKFKEADPFLTDADTDGSLVGQDFIPLLGGPFNKQLYIYDYLKMHATSFHAYHHDPLGRRIVNVIRDFTLGRGWKVTCKDPFGAALWDAFEQANELYNLMDFVALEIEIYGETMLWSLPNGETKIIQNPRPGEKIPKGTIPRVRIIDPSVIWEIITYPEDITRVLAYQWVAPTQYQIYTDNPQGERVSSSKFIYQQIPGEQVDHWKINCVSNEKRGRSGLFPVLGYLKRLRDTVQYSIIAMQKAAAWAIDTKIDGDQADIDGYVESQKQIGTIAPAGSEFVHSTKVERQYISNSATSKGGSSQSFDWCLTMIASGTGIPIGYLNTHLSGGQTRASALVATEPVTKMFEKRQLLYEQILKKLAKRLFTQFNVDAEIEVTFPELVVQDRSAKLKDLALAQTQGWISQKRAAEIAAQELQITEYAFDKETDEIKKEETLPLPRTSPLNAPGASGLDTPSPDASRSDVNGDSKRALDQSGGF